ncbi:hypothetical protein GCM10020229_31280 [Kitasatospora albolonga]
MRRTARLAEQLGLPLVTLVDTSGAELSVQAELDGLALEIARTLETLVALRTPVLAVLLGQGSGGGALALLPADTVLAAASGWLAPCRRRAPRRSCTGTAGTPRSWPAPRASGRPTWSRRAWWTGYCRRATTRAPAPASPTGSPTPSVRASPT